ncbi:hypothetical protein HN935_00295 [archaeon]|jgi:hypothetical protein|nr:hypothetical protein [archaeon]
MSQAQQDSERYAQRTAEEFNTFGGLHGFNFLAEAKDGKVTFEYRGEHYSLEYQGNGAGPQAVLEKLANDGGTKGWKELSRLVPEFKGKSPEEVPQELYVNFLKRVLSVSTDCK